MPPKSGGGETSKLGNCFMMLDRIKIWEIYSCHKLSEKCKVKSGQIYQRQDNRSV